MGSYKNDAMIQRAMTQNPRRLKRFNLTIFINFYEWRLYNKFAKIDTYVGLKCPYWVAGRALNATIQMQYLCAKTIHIYIIIFVRVKTTYTTFD